MEDWNKTEIETFLAEKHTGYLYFYTPICGTCQLASKMLTVIEQLLPELRSGKADLNFLPEMAERFEIESVPCLILIKNGEVQEKIYAFQSVPYLFEKLTELQG
ncbi:MULTISPECIES: thioredoxin family protein [Mesobacillus]|uniref:Thioredoxin n=2 Tax=Mesobacillus TaxID=2675231 RepID=A0A0D6ZCM2_9BACI|nr:MULTISPECIES: thioredoxin family protein [Mesobacillus]KIY23277.1 thioredoxin [Mesobacillus subterraneus]MDQ0412640.1 thioredoxin-like negative regulator of GroEL [Mesobacillus stamsii]